MDWTAEAIDQLRTLWSEGHSTAEIGRRMGVSKNAVVGKAHRLNLPARPSPIRREADAGGAPLARRGVPAARPLLPMRRLEPGPVAAPAPVQAPEPVPEAPVAVAPVPTPAAVAPVVVPVAPPVVASVPAPAPVAAPRPVAVLRPFQMERPRATARSCCWPIGEPGTPQFRFCGGDALTGKPYCAEHAAVAYVKARDRREDAA